jgi:hypothetical protein
VEAAARAGRCGKMAREHWWPRVAEAAAPAGGGGGGCRGTQKKGGWFALSRRKMKRPLLLGCAPPRNKAVIGFGNNETGPLLELGLHWSSTGVSMPPYTYCQSNR